MFNRLLQNTLDVTVTALAVQNKREHPNRVKGFVETVVPNYCDPTFASHFRMKRQTFQLKDNPLLTSETVLLSVLCRVCHVFPPPVSIFSLFPVLVKCHYELILVQPCFIYDLPVYL